MDNGDGTTSEEEYTVAVPLKSLPEIYGNLQSAIGRKITYEKLANDSEIYYCIGYGGNVPTYGEEFDAWVNGLPLSDAPFTGQRRGHFGLDMGASEGTPIHAALDGTVLFVRYKNTGYGYHLAIDHGGGFVTIYARWRDFLLE